MNNFSKIVIYSNEYRIKEIYRVVRDYKINKDTIEWNEGSNSIGITSPYIIVESDRTIELITQEEIIDFMKAPILKRLSDECEKLIQKPFYSETNDAMFGFNMKDQGNITSQLILFTLDTSTSETTWKTKDKGILTISRDNFIALAKEGEKHKRKYIDANWKIQNHITKNVNTFEELQEIGSLEEEMGKLKSK